jgi:hypothetical protein
MATLTVTSRSIPSDGTIPVDETCDGTDKSPELSWSAPPPGTKSLAVIVDDPDASSGEFTHWLAFNIRPDVLSLPEGLPQYPVLEALHGALQGQNSWGTAGYRGPAPPKGHGTHHYHFRLYALNAPLSASQGLDKKGLFGALHNHILAEAELVGTYER